MVVVQPTAFCNINCTYCYLPDRNNKHVIAQSTVMRLFSEIFASGWTCPEITVVWHAGEPLAVPVSFYREAFAAIERMRPESVIVKHSFQTNGMLIDAEWCRLFLEWNVGVGVSIDGPRALHDRHRKTRSGKGTFDKTLAGIRSLRANGVPFHVISVLSRDSLSMADELLDFYLSEGIDQICFNIEESEGDHVSDLFAPDHEGLPLRTRYAAFLRRFWHRARASGLVKFVREIDLALPRVFRPDGSPTRNIQTEPLAMATSRVSRPSCWASRTRITATSCWAISTVSRSPRSIGHASSPHCTATSRRVSRRAVRVVIIFRSAAAAHPATSCSRTARSPARRRRTVRSRKWCRPTLFSKPMSVSSKAGPRTIRRPSSN
jgi:sulfatase maturation enzyme AslB (radical SAM superfamily)